MSASQNLQLSMLLSFSLWFIFVHIQPCPCPFISILHPSPTPPISPPQLLAFTLPYHLYIFSVQLSVSLQLIKVATMLLLDKRHPELNQERCAWEKPRRDLIISYQL